MEDNDSFGCFEIILGFIILTVILSLWRCI